MRVPDETRKCVAFVGMKTARGYEVKGTAFFIGRRRQVGDHNFSFMYAVTAKHVIDGIRDKGSDICMRVNFRDGSSQWIESKASSWRFHPDDLEIDVAVLELMPNDQVDLLLFPLEAFATDEIISKEGIGIGDTVFLTGLFASHYGRKRNIPIVRMGNIAAMPEEPIETSFGLFDAYLVESRSIGGLSGSPVFVQQERLRMHNGELVYAPLGSPFYLLGLMHGHWDAPMPNQDDVTTDILNKETVNMGIAMVIPATKIREVITQPAIKDFEDRMEDELRKSQLPTPDSTSEPES
jgi:hypothetical protein